MNMGDHCPWEAKKVNPQEPFNENTLPSLRESIWLLKTSIIGNYCISCPKGQHSTLIGDLICLGQKFYNDVTQETQWWVGSPSHTEPQPHLLTNFPKLAMAWNNLTVGIKWRVSKGLYWISGE
jgi:hypothetical protein